MTVDDDLAEAWAAHDVWGASLTDYRGEKPKARYVTSVAEGARPTERLIRCERAFADSLGVSGLEVARMRPRAIHEAGHDYKAAVALIRAQMSSDRTA